MKQYKVSIIIPCFNVELYILECLQSVFNTINSHSEVEVIIINDGSTDRTNEIIGSIASSHSNCRVIEQENGGLSAARNTGLDIANGEYIAFLDGDDILSRDYIPEIIQAIAKSSPDIIEIDAFRFDGISREDFPLCSYFGEMSVSTPLDLKPVYNLAKWYVWGRIYKSDIIGDFRFEKGRRYEDMMFTPYIYLNARKIYGINKKLLGYRHTPNSITKTIKECDYTDTVYALQKLSNAYDRTTSSDEKSILMLSRVKNFSYLKFITNNFYGYFSNKMEVKTLANKIIKDNKLLDKKHQMKNKDLINIKYFALSSFVSWVKVNVLTIIHRT